MLLMDEQKPQRQKANRKGVVVNTTVSEEIHDALERYIADQTVEPKKTTIVQTALRDFFIHLGYMEGELSKAADGGVQRHVAPHLGELGLRGTIEGCRRWRATGVRRPSGGRNATGGV
jgi:hypothetical protein